jgi:hypothetical protein
LFFGGGRCHRFVGGKSARRSRCRIQAAIRKDAENRM